MEKIYKWLSPPNESLNYNAAHAILESQPDTCQWFLKEYISYGWLKQPGFFSIKGKGVVFVDGFSSTFIVLDALDECIEKEKLLNWIQTFIAEKDKNLGLHLIVTSHPEQEIEDKLTSSHYLDLVKESGNHGLVAYLDYQLQNDSDLQQWNFETQNQIKLKLM